MGPPGLDGASDAGWGQVLALVLVPATAMVLLGFLAFAHQPEPVLVAAMQHLAAGIVLSAVSVELVPIVSSAPSTLANNTSMCLGFICGVALFIGVGQSCEVVDEEQETPTAAMGRKRRSKLGIMRASTETPTRRPNYESVESSSSSSEDEEEAVVYKFPTTMLLAVSVDALCDGFLIGLSAASAARAGVIMSVALTIEMGFLSLTFAATLRRSPRWIGVAAMLVPPVLLVGGGLLGALVASTLAVDTALHVGFISFGIAALLYLVTEELLLEAHESQGERDHIAWVDACFFLGFLASFLLEKIIQASTEDDHSYHSISAR